jgi:hypothetical protein
MAVGIRVHRLNSVTEPDVSPLPNMLDFAAKAGSCTVFSMIDLCKVYHQISFNPENVQKSTITNPFNPGITCFQTNGISKFCLEGCRQERGSYVP